MSGETQLEPRLERRSNHWLGRFDAMASPCEVLVSGLGPKHARTAVAMAEKETRRIEQKFSRYRSDNVVHRIHAAEGESVDLDEETDRLLAYADHLYRMSDGAFDITSGSLRQVWNFDGSDAVPAPAQVSAVLTRVGWHQVEWTQGRLRLPKGMQIDLGGIGKEYAVDRVADLLAAEFDASILVNFGGDMRANRPPEDGEAWAVGVESPDQEGSALRRISLSSGAVATSGDARRFLLKDGIRYGHVLDARTGWPPRDAPRSISVAAATCTEAGSLSTLAMLQGAKAREFLEAQQCRYWCVD